MANIFLNFGTLVSANIISLTAFQYLKTFLIRLIALLINVIFKILYNQMCQHLKDLHKPVNQYSASKGTAKQMNRQDTDWEKRFANHIPNKRFIQNI